MTKVDWPLVLLTIIISPIGLLCLDKKIQDKDVLINLVLFLLLTPLVGLIHAFYVLNTPLVISICNTLLPPLGVFLSTKDLTKTIISVLLMFLFFLPGVVYSHYQSLNYGSKKGGLI